MIKQPKFLFTFPSKKNVKNIFLTRRKLIWIAISTVSVFIILLFLSINFLSEIVYQSKLARIKKSNNRLVSTIYDLKSRMQIMESDLNVLLEKDRALRTYVDIPAIDRDVRKLGIGGKVLIRASEVDKLIPGDNIRISKLSNDLDRLARVLKLERISYESIYDAFKHRSDQIQSTPSIRPINTGYITDGFGYRRDPFSGKRRFHYGIDISTPFGTPVYATADGVVRSCNYSITYGKITKLDHGFGYSTVYAHLSKTLVKPGEVVKRGQKIAEVGCTGRSTAPHLHYEVQQFGIRKNPLNYFFIGYVGSQ
ncbi:MAG: M23 family metallopeptidase [Candidatus Marinimicrobia bacterium]|nr:M23 family metallopeptidase [Candidatus Neomarinimicrobiota bacterium]